MRRSGPSQQRPVFNTTTRATRRVFPLPSQRSIPSLGSGMQEAGVAGVPGGSRPPALVHFHPVFPDTQSIFNARRLTACLEELGTRTGVYSKHSVIMHLLQ